MGNYQKNSIKTEYSVFQKISENIDGYRNKIRKSEMLGVQTFF